MPKKRPEVKVSPTREASVKVLAQQQSHLPKGASVRERAEENIKMDAYQRHLKRDVIKVGSSAGLGIVGKFKTLNPTRGSGELEGYTLKSHYVPSVTRPNKVAEVELEKAPNNVPKQPLHRKPRKPLKGQRACGGSVFRPHYD